VVSKLFHANEQTDTQTYLTKLMVTFHNLEYVPKRHNKYYLV